jgi:hypothetical protein
VVVDDLLPLQGGRRRSCMSRIACAWISSISSSAISPVRASSTVGERRMSAMTSSSASRRLEQPAQDVDALLGLAQAVGRCGAG